MTCDLEEQIQNNTSLMAENSQKQSDVKKKEEEIDFKKKDIAKINKVLI